MTDWYSVRGRGGLIVEAIGRTEGADLMRMSSRSSTSWLLSRLRRVTSAGDYIPEVDGMRFIAISWVFLFHVAVDLAAKDPAKWTLPTQGLGSAIGAGAFGVQIFFVISGFVLALPFARYRLMGERKVSMRKYFMRRVTRLEPPYMLVMALLFIVVALRSENFAGSLGHLFASLGYSHGLIFGTESAINNVAWSLEVEIQFYVLVPLLALIFSVRRRRSRLAILGSAAALAAVLGALLIPAGSRASLTVLNYAAYFLVGFILADLHLQGWTRRPRKAGWDLVAIGVIAAMLAIILSCGASDAGVIGAIAGHVLLPAVSALFIACAFRSRIFGWLVASPSVTLVGGMCYSIYLVHNAILGVTLSGTRFVRTGVSWEVDYAIQVVISVFPVALVSLVLFVLLERPCMQSGWPTRLMASVRRKLSPKANLALETE